MACVESRARDSMQMPVAEALRGPEGHSMPVHESVKATLYESDLQTAIEVPAGCEVAEEHPNNTAHERVATDPLRQENVTHGGGSSPRNAIRRFLFTRRSPDSIAHVADTPDGLGRASAGSMASGKSSENAFTRSHSYRRGRDQHACDSLTRHATNYHGRISRPKRCSSRRPEPSLATSVGTPKRRHLQDLTNLRAERASPYIDTYRTVQRTHYTAITTYDGCASNTTTPMSTASKKSEVQGAIKTVMQELHSMHEALGGSCYEVLRCYVNDHEQHTGIPQATATSVPVLSSVDKHPVPSYATAMKAPIYSLKKHSMKGEDKENIKNISLKQ